MDQYSTGTDLPCVVPAQQPHEYLERLGSSVRARRERLGLSQEEFAFECEMDRTYISGIERGVRNPTVKTLIQLARALNTTPGRLLTAAEKLR